MRCTGHGDTPVGGDEIWLGPCFHRAPPGGLPRTGRARATRRAPSPGPGRTRPRHAPIRRGTALPTLTVSDPARTSALEFTPDGRLVPCANRDVYAFRADSPRPCQVTGSSLSRSATRACRRRRRLTGSVWRRGGGRGPGPRRRTWLGSCGRTWPGSVTSTAGHHRHPSAAVHTRHRAGRGRVPAGDSAAALEAAVRDR